MKRSTAVRHLREIADGCRPAVFDAEVPLLVELWVFGELLGAAVELEVIDIVGVLNLSVSEVPWMSTPLSAEAMAKAWRWDRLPVRRWWRPEGSPVWNHRIVSPVRVWSSDGGLDLAMLDAIAERRLGDLRVVGPAGTDELIAELDVEHAAAMAHLRAVVDGFHNRDWRRGHKGGGEYPDDHLWAAAFGLTDLDQAIARLKSPPPA